MRNRWVGGVVGVWVDGMGRIGEVTKVRAFVLPACRKKRV